MAMAINPIKVMVPLLLFAISFHPAAMPALQVDIVIGDRCPTLEDIRALRFTTRVINESMRLYPQPPVLIRRVLEEDTLGGFPLKKGADMFISVWNIHRSALKAMYELGFGLEICLEAVCTCSTLGGGAAVAI